MLNYPHSENIFLMSSFLIYFYPVLIYDRCLLSTHYTFSWRSWLHLFSNNLSDIERILAGPTKPSLLRAEQAQLP